MSSLPTTLSGLLLTTADAPASEAMLDAQAFTELRGKISGLPQIGWPAAKSTIVDAIAAMLDVKLVDILAQTWSKLNDLQEYLDKKRHPPEETAIVPLLKHSVRSTHKPTLELLAGEEVIARLVFDVVLVLSLEGIALKIRDGRVTDVVSGTCQGKGTLKLGDETIAEKSTPVYVVPGAISFGDGLAIPRVPNSPE